MGGGNCGCPIRLGDLTRAASPDPESHLDLEPGPHSDSAVDPQNKMGETAVSTAP